MNIEVVTKKDKDVPLSKELPLEVDFSSRLSFQSWVYSAVQAAVQESVSDSKTLHWELTWIGGGIAITIVFLQFFLQLFQVGYNAFSMAVYALSSIFTAPFAFLYGSSGEIGRYDAPALLSVIALLLLTWGVTYYQKYNNQKLL